MSAPSSEPAALLDAGLTRLAELLGASFALTRRPPAADTGPSSTRIAAAVVDVQDNAAGVYTEVLVDAVPTLSPAEADRLFRPRADLLHRMQSRAVLLVLTGWLSPRTRAVLDGLDVNYLDLTGNARLDIDRPRILVRMEGARIDPRPSTTGPRRLAGPRAGRLVRWLIDRPPPYRVTELADRTLLSAGYVSRLVDAIEDLGLLRREGRLVTEVDWIGLIRERADATSLLRANQAVTMLASRGPQAVLASLAGTDLGVATAVTGAVAAAAVAPLAVGGQLMLYVPSDAGGPEEAARTLGLLPTTEGANVVLLVPADPVVLDRRRLVDGVGHVALSQLAIDCLSGPDRLPAAGEAVLQQMIDTEADWRTAD